MDTTQGVSVITLTIPGREKMLERSTKCVLAQTYSGSIEQIVVSGGGTIGHKRNIGCRAAAHEIILMYDDDDIMEPEHIEKALPFLKHCDVTGLSSVVYLDEKTGQRYLYKYTGGQPYVIGSGMMFWKRVWRKNPYPEIQIGEDAKFLSKAGRIVPHGLIDLFTATLHGGNTASQDAVKFMEIM